MLLFFFFLRFFFLLSTSLTYNRWGESTVEDQVEVTAGQVGKYPPPHTNKSS